MLGHPRYGDLFTLCLDNEKDIEGYIEGLNNVSQRTFEM